MKVVCFTLDGTEDTENGDTLEERLKFMCQGLENYRCIQFQKNGVGYAYLSEYLAVILLDCFISALKASEAWSSKDLGYEVFQELSQVKSSKKCKVSIFREIGEGSCDYLVIENDIHLSNMNPQKNGPGMSQAAIRWYIEKLWKFVLCAQDKCPEVIMSPTSKKEKYQIKLPILEKIGGKCIY